MEGKFIIFVLVASLAQSFFAQPLNVTYGLAKDEFVDLNMIVFKQDVALVAMYGGFNPLFDIIQKSASSLIYDHGVSVGPGIVPTILKARLSARKAWDQCLDVILIAVGGRCSAVEEARKATHANLVSAYDAIISAIFMSATGKSSAALQTMVLDYLTNSKERAYNSMRICADMKDDNQLAIVQQFENTSRLTLAHLTNALFNSMNVNAAAVSDRKADVSLIYTIEGFRQQALDAIRINMATGFSAVKAFYIFSSLKQTEILSGLVSNQFTLAITTHKFEAMIDAIYKTILNHSDRASLGLKDAGRPTFTSDDAEEATTLVSLISGCNSLLDYIYTVYSNDISAVELRIFKNKLETSSRSWNRLLQCHAMVARKFSVTR